MNIDLKKTAERALASIDEGRELAAEAMAKLETADLVTSPTWAQELEAALAKVTSGHQILHALMLIGSAQIDVAAISAAKDGGNE